MYDDIFNIHYITQVYTKSPLFEKLSDHACKNVWVVSIVPEEPIIDYFDSAELHQNQKIGWTNTIYISITWRKISISSNIQEIQATFDQVWTIFGYSEFFTNKPPTPSDIRNFFGDTHNNHYIYEFFLNAITINWQISSLFLYLLRKTPQIKSSWDISYHQK